MRLSSYSPHGGSSANDVAFDAVAFAPASVPTYKVVTLGDSYSSGEGLSPFLAGSDTDNDQCHRSSQAYSNLVTLPASSTPLGQNTADEFEFLACSGAHTTSITSAAVNTVGQENPYDSGWGSANYDSGEELQASQGYLDSRTDAVFLSVGGNDARFADIVTTCAISGTIGNNCSASTYVMSGDSEPLTQYEPHLIADLLPAKLKSVYTAVHAAAPNAKIFVMGYPRLFPTTSAAYASCPLDLPIGFPAMTWMNSMADLLSTTTQSAVSAVAAQGVSIYYVNPITSFTGHDVCASSSWLNAIVGLPTSPGPGSFHPKPAGQAGYASLLTAALALHPPTHH